jgi:hypothetical protein
MIPSQTLASPMSYPSVAEMTIERRRSLFDQMAEISAYRFGLARRLTSLAHWQIRSRCLSVLLRWIWAGFAMDRPSPSRSGPRVIFLRNCSVILNYLQSSKIHKYFSIHANEVIQISLSTLGYYLSDGIGLIILGTM